MTPRCACLNAKKQLRPNPRHHSAALKNGVYIVEPGKGTLSRMAIEADVDALFIKLLAAIHRAGRNVTYKTGNLLRARTVCQAAEAQQGKVASKAFADSMERLFNAKRIQVVPEGPPHPRTRLVEADSTALPPPSTALPPGCVYSPPITPARWERARGRWYRPPVPPANGKDKQAEPEAEPPMWS